MDAVRVLLVDDSEAFLRSAAIFLTEICNVDLAGCASSGEQAIEMVHALNPQIVVMDVLMNGISGIEAARRIKQMKNPPHILLVSLDSYRYYDVAITDAPVEGFVNKAEFTRRIPQLIAELSRTSE